MGLGPFAVWQMVDYPNKRTNYLGFPSVPGHCREQQRAQQHRPANSGSAGTEGSSHTSPVSLPGIFIFPPFPFLPHFSLSTLTHSSRSLAKSQSAQTDLGGVFLFHDTILLLCLGGFEEALIRG